MKLAGGFILVILAVVFCALLAVSILFGSTPVKAAGAVILAMLLVVFCAMLAVVILFGIVRNLHKVYCWFREAANLQRTERRQ